ncbi:MAG: N-acetylmuramoyl-L-alanine amidase [Lysobacterales bacterium]
MWGAKRPWGSFALSIALPMAAVTGAHAARIDAVRLDGKGPSTRAVLELSGPVEYKLFALGNPDRVVVDLRDSNFASGFRAPDGGRGVVKDLRAGVRDKTNARLVFDMDGGVTPKTFLQRKTGGDGYRLVVEFSPRNSGSAPVKTVASSVADRSRDLVVAIDAGHGGVDPGAKGSDGTYEKTITLAVARKLAALVDATPGMKAVLTRDGDVFVPLKERYRKAREAKADLFVSIHADACPGSCDARGASVWVLSTRGATSEAARWLADRENRADLVGGVSLDDKDDTLAAVLLDLSQGATIGASNAVAKRVLKSLRNVGPTHRRYVEHANFVVLRSPDVPSILIETAFITNPSEERNLRNAAHREELAQAILDGIVGYFRATPPPGTLFAEEAERGRKVRRQAAVDGEGSRAIARRDSTDSASMRAANSLADDHRARADAGLQVPSG